MLRGIGLFFLSVVMMMLATLLVLGINSYVMLYPGVYEKAFEAGGFYTFAENEFGKDERMSIIDFSDKDVRSSVNTLLENMLSYVRGDSGLNLTLQINQTALSSFFEKQVDNLDACVADEEPFSGDEVNCRPPNKTSAEFLPEILEKKHFNISNATSVDLVGVFDEDRNLNKLKEVVKKIKISVVGLTLGILLIVVLIYFVSGRSVKTAARWSGASLIAVSVFVSPALLFLKSKADYVIGTNTGFFSKMMPIFAEEIFHNLLVSLSAVFLIGAVLLVFSLLINKK